MNRTCVRCGRHRWHRARGLCDLCYRWHRDEYQTLPQRNQPLVCVCRSPRIVPVEGVWGGLATVCDRCQRPRIGPQEAL